MKTRTVALVGAYLGAIVAANLSVARFGPAVTIINAFLFIGLDLTARDFLHEEWHNKPSNLGWLIAVGSLISFALGAGRVAIASAVAFALSGLADTVMYSLLHDRAVLLRVNGSNVVSATVDSLTFPTLAFGSFMPWVVAGQFAAKVLGGAVWSLLLRPLYRRMEQR